MREPSSLALNSEGTHRKHTRKPMARIVAQALRTWTSKRKSLARQREKHRMQARLSPSTSTRLPSPNPSRPNRLVIFSRTLASSLKMSSVYCHRAAARPRQACRPISSAGTSGKSVSASQRAARTKHSSSSSSSSCSRTRYFPSSPCSSPAFSKACARARPAPSLHRLRSGTRPTAATSSELHCELLMPKPLREASPAKTSPHQAPRH